MGPVQKLEGMLAAMAFAKLKLKITARDFKNSSLKLNIVAFMLRFKSSFN